jgi:hypothetical protein
MSVMEKRGLVSPEYTELSVSAQFKSLVYNAVVTTLSPEGSHC